MSLLENPVRRSPPYMGESDSEVRYWASNFADQIENVPAYGISPADAAFVRNLLNQYITFYDMAQSASTRTSPIVLAKTETRQELEQVCRAFAMQIKADPGVSDDLKTNAGIHLDDQVRTPIGAPRTQPILNIVSAGPGTHTLRFRDMNTMSSRRKPAGITHMLLFAEIARPGHAKGVDAGLEFMGAVTRNPYRVRFDYDRHAGRIAHYKARWLTAKGLLGPWSAMISMPIFFAGVPVVEMGDGSALRQAA